jgi:MFS family permease
MESAQRRKSLIVIYASAFGAGMTMGCILPLLTLLMERAELGATLIGLNAAMFPLAVFCAGPFAPAIVRRFGVLPTLWAASAVFILVIPLFYLTDFEVWFLLRFVSGVAGALSWVTTEIWVNVIAGEKTRGRVMAVYTMTIAGGFAIGPLIVGALGIDGFLPYLACLIATAIWALPLIFARGLPPDMSHQSPMRLGRALRAAPTALLAAVAGGIADMAIIALLPVYGIAQGFGEAKAAAFLSVFGAGSLLLQWPLGWLADRWSRRGTLIVTFVAALLGAALLPLTVGHPWAIWPLLFLWGGMVFGIYTAALALLGQRVPAVELGAANAVFIMAYEAGSLSGPPAAGLAMDHIGANGLPITVMVVSAAFLAFAAIRSIDLARAKAAPGG